MTLTKKKTSETTKNTVKTCVSKVSRQVKKTLFTIDRLRIKLFKENAHKKSYTISHDFLASSLDVKRLTILRAFQKLESLGDVIATERVYNGYTSCKIKTYVLTKGGAKKARKDYQETNPYKGYFRDPVTGDSFTFKPGRFPASAVQENRLSKNDTVRASTKDNINNNINSCNERELNACACVHIHETDKGLKQHKVTKENLEVKKAILKQLGWLRHLTYRGFNSFVRFPASTLQRELRSHSLGANYPDVFDALRAACYADGMIPDHEWAKAHLGDTKSCYRPEHEVYFEKKKEGYLKVKLAVAQDKGLAACKLRAQKAAAEKIKASRRFSQEEIPTKVIKTKRTVTPTSKWSEELRSDLELRAIAQRDAKEQLKKTTFADQEKSTINMLLSKGYSMERIDMILAPSRSRNSNICANQ